MFPNFLQQTGLVYDNKRTKWWLASWFVSASDQCGIYDLGYLLLKINRIKVIWVDFFKHIAEERRNFFFLWSMLIVVGIGFGAIIEYGGKKFISFLLFLCIPLNILF